MNFLRGKIEQKAWGEQPGRRLTFHSCKEAPGGYKETSE